MSTADFTVSRRAIFMAGGAALLLAGCAGRQTPNQIYVLRPQLPQAPAGDKVSWQLSIATPNAAASLNIDRIALTRTTGTQDYFADAQWNDRLPVILQTALVDAFTGSGRISAVSRDVAGLRADYVLETEIKDFTAHYESADAPPDAVVDLRVNLVSLSDRTIAGSFESKESAAATANNVGAIAAAFNTALGKSLGDIVAWALKTAPAVAASPAAGTASTPKPAHNRRRRRRRAAAAPGEATPEQ
jgi:cholesterol transport system auxiliary component